MTRAELLAFLKSATERMLATAEKKNADYTGASDDPFHNFSRVEAIGIASTEQGFLTRMFDKFARVTTFIQKGALSVKDETVEDTLFDLANYCLLLAAYINSKRPLRGEAASPLGPFDTISPKTLAGLNHHKKPGGLLAGEPKEPVCYCGHGPELHHGAGACFGLMYRRGVAPSNSCCSCQQYLEDPNA